MANHVITLSGEWMEKTYPKSVCILSEGLISNDILFSVELLFLSVLEMLSFSDTVRLRRRIRPFSALKLPRRISAVSTMRMLTRYSWQWLSCPAARYVRVCSALTAQFITTLAPVSCLITSSATKRLPLCDSSNISYGKYEAG